jgi:hypothetical protein
MNVSVGQLINDAKDLINRLKERESNLDQVVLQSNALAKRVDAIQQVCFYYSQTSFLISIYLNSLKMNLLNLTIKQIINQKLPFYLIFRKKTA